MTKVRGNGFSKPIGEMLHIRWTKITSNWRPPEGARQSYLARLHDSPICFDPSTSITGLYLYLGAAISDLVPPAPITLRISPLVAPSHLVTFRPAGSADAE